MILHLSAGNGLSAHLDWTVHANFFLPSGSLKGSSNRGLAMRKFPEQLRTARSETTSAGCLLPREAEEKGVPGGDMLKIQIGPAAALVWESLNGPDSAKLGLARWQELKEYVEPCAEVRVQKGGKWCRAAGPLLLTWTGASREYPGAAGTNPETADAQRTPDSPPVLDLWDFLFCPPPPSLSSARCCRMPDGCGCCTPPGPRTRHRHRCKASSCPPGSI
ncbi:uncharacterized protein [Struthio camelus]|uniref:uncharacterized protein isoform X2 n=1 Tax=Struthio camelus TaxID=8801 RepID=UPI00360415D2